MRSPTLRLLDESQVLIAGIADAAGDAGQPAPSDGYRATGIVRLGLGGMKLVRR